MIQSTFENIRIAGIATAVPKKREVIVKNITRYLAKRQFVHFPRRRESWSAVLQRRSRLPRIWLTWQQNI